MRERSTILWSKGILFTSLVAFSIVASAGEGDVSQKHFDAAGPQAVKALKLEHEDIPKIESELTAAQNQLAKVKAELAKPETSKPENAANKTKLETQQKELENKISRKPNKDDPKDKGGLKEELASQKGQLEEFKNGAIKEAAKGQRLKDAPEMGKQLSAAKDQVAQATAKENAAVKEFNDLRKSMTDKFNEANGKNLTEQEFMQTDEFHNSKEIKAAQDKILAAGDGVKSANANLEGVQKGINDAQNMFTGEGAVKSVEGGIRQLMGDEQGAANAFGKAKESFQDGAKFAEQVANPNKQVAPENVQPAKPVQDATTGNSNFSDSIKDAKPYSKVPMNDAYDGNFKTEVKGASAFSESYEGEPIKNIQYKDPSGKTTNFQPDGKGGFIDPVQGKTATLDGDVFKVTGQGSNEPPPTASGLKKVDGAYYDSSGQFKFNQIPETRQLNSVQIGNQEFTYAGRGTGQNTSQYISPSGAAVELNHSTGALTMGQSAWTQYSVASNGLAGGSTPPATSVPSTRVPTSTSSTVQSSVSNPNFSYFNPFTWNWSGMWNSYFN